MSYQQARREIVEQINWLDAYPHLAIMWEVGRPLTNSRPGKEHYRAALGGIELALRECDVLVGAFNRDSWRTIDGHIDLDWEGGPFAQEVVQTLVVDAERPECGPLYPGELIPGISRIGDLNAVWIGGVRVRFRPYEPIGLEASQREAWARIRSASPKRSGRTGNLTPMNS